ncbi:VanZ family protein [Accumulibacter sp.]|uniref:VanZ family protein n=1 Tax=Accumulibacter sp. TaxID=2053492 RepID=UPI0025DFF55F|nr:VanZ family protein [Accumulibacter sp.]MCM8611308.1 VanZ family protein [Accumulibacter sp.]MCM8635045.1 VanZ family protein [Accumulibacter sp.]MCM8639833.1 VanZ family protein [Accumulibacter sp.]
MSVDAPRAPAAQGSSRLWLAWLVYTAFVVYGSLVPLGFHPRPLSDALAEFGHIRMLNLGIDQRADWVANGVLYLPLAFLTATVLGAGRHSRRRILPVAGALAFSLLVAVGVEFLQLFFPPRTVSINDVLAESVGSMIGALLAYSHARHLRQLADSLAQRRAGLLPGLLIAYALAYLAYCGFPYDFVVSTAELQAKLASGSTAWFKAENNQRGPLLGVLTLAVEVLAAVPLGLLLGRWLSPAPVRRLLLGGLASGLAIGLLIELGQLFIYSSVSQGISVLTRAAGVTAGALLSRSPWRLSDVALLLRRFLPALCGLYALALIGVHGWLNRPWGGIDQAARRFADVNFLPFYYHYYTTEMAALTSLVSVAFIYAPIGVLAWVAHLTPRIAGIVAALAASIIEVGKLFNGPAHPDPTNVLLATLSAWVCVRLLARLAAASEPPRSDADGPTAPRLPTSDDERLARRHRQPATRRDGQESGLAAAAAADDTRSGQRRPSAAAWITATALIAAAAWGVLSHPLQPALLGLMLAACGFLVWRHPPALVVIVAAAVPMLDFAAQTGWLMLSEFDLLLLVVWAAVLLLPRSRRSPLPFDLPFALAAGAFALSWVSSLVVGLLPLQALDANAFASYYSHYNALRVAKGALWGLTLPFLVARSVPLTVDVRRLFALGMVAGMAWTIADIAWERSAFVGLLDFDQQYRVSGPFSVLHVGGSVLECYLVLALPFLAYAIARWQHPLLRLAGLLLFGGAVYGVLVTYSRAGLAALALTVVLIVLTFAWHVYRRPGGRPVHLGIGLSFAVVALMAAIPVVTGSFLQSRLSHAQTDTGVRFAYWHNSLAMIDGDWPSRLFGMGLGRFPLTFYWRSTHGDRPGTYRFESENGNTFVRLGDGSGIYLDQTIALEPQTDYRLSFDARSKQPVAEARAFVSICEKRLIQSQRCVTPLLRPDAAVAGWQRFSVTFNSGKISERALWLRAPVKLSLHNGGGVVDVDNLDLRTDGGRNLLRNGDFERVNERWWLTVDDYWPWHVENLWLHTFFEQGWFGLLSLALLVAGSLLAIARRVWRGELFAGALLASWAGALAVGALNSPNDSPQIVFLLLVLAWLSFGVPPRAQTGGRDSSRTT